MPSFPGWSRLIQVKLSFQGFPIRTSQSPLFKCVILKKKHDTQFKDILENLSTRSATLCNSICERQVITGFGVIVDIIAILFPATPDKIYRTIKRNDFPIFRHIRQILPLMQIYGKIFEHGIENMACSMNILCIDHILYVFNISLATM